MLKKKNKGKEDYKKSEKKELTLYILLEISPVKLVVERCSKWTFPEGD